MVEAIEESLVFIKPDAVAKRYVGEIIHRFEAAELDIIQVKKINMDTTLADQHYAEHVHKSFYPSLKDFITSGPIVVMVLRGSRAIARIRALCGATNPSDAEPGSIRSDFGVSMTENAIHASDSVESARREISNFSALF
ncbi:nucleoside-diphosphate kinase [bacterium]|nr:nucleoside-diphosphate kinase [bacterium]|tara:strand:- start:2553 stop:2969 length:417 start_codon:yes stop_codon:yes gene_type:complete